MVITDIVIICLFAPAIIKGLKDGFFKQAAGILSLFLGAYLAYRFSDLASSYISEWIKASPEIIKIISFALIMIGVIFLVSLAGKLITKLFDMAALGWMNRILGVITACLTAALILGLLAQLILYINATWFEIVPKEQLAESKLFKPLCDMADFIFPYLKDFFKIG